MAHARCMLDKQGYMFSSTCTCSRARRPSPHTPAPTCPQTHREICNNYCFSKETLVSRTHFNVTLYVRCLSCCLCMHMYRFTHCIRYGSGEMCSIYRTWLSMKFHVRIQSVIAYVTSLHEPRFQAAGLRIPLGPNFWHLSVTHVYRIKKSLCVSMRSHTGLSSLFWSLKGITKRSPSSCLL